MTRNPAGGFQLSGIRLPPGHGEGELLRAVAERLGGKRPESWRILRRSLDARGRPAYEYTVGVEAGGLAPAGATPWRPHAWRFRLVAGEGKTPVVVGAGPAGIFAALRLAEYGLRPLVIERGKPVEERMRDVGAYWRTGAPDPDSNVLFGEGGAGAFSDGKLTSRSKDAARKAWVLEKLVAAGAAPEIRYEAKPHLGTDKLRRVVAGLRRLLLQAGGEALFGRKALKLALQDGRARGIVAADGGEIGGDAVFLACGHSAPELVAALAAQGMAVSPKAFALGLRVEVSQEEVDARQYGRWAGQPGLPPSEFALTHTTPGGLGVYSFCMCPGGTVIPCGDAPEGLVVNGMSGAHRGGRHANAALVVETRPEVFCQASDGPLAGFSYQRRWERAARELAGPRAAPAQTVASFLGRGAPPLAASSCPWPLTEADLRGCLPPHAALGLAQALPAMIAMLPPLAGGMLLGVETRTSSPARIERGENMESATIPGLYPIGEGAGAAGGIVSSAIDGARAADAYAARLGGSVEAA